LVCWVRLQMRRGKTSAAQYRRKSSIFKIKHVAHTYAQTPTVAVTVTSVK
jgi:hypothetical protein